MRAWGILPHLPRLVTRSQLRRSCYHTALRPPPQFTRSAMYGQHTSLFGHTPILFLSTSDASSAPRSIPPAHSVDFLYSLIHHYVNPHASAHHKSPASHRTHRLSRLLPLQSPAPHDDRLRCAADRAARPHADRPVMQSHSAATGTDTPVKPPAPPLVSQNIFVSSKKLSAGF